MRKIFSLLCFVVGCLLSLTASAQTYSVSEKEALEIAQRQFQDQDVDYYIQDYTASTNWVIFVDAEPMKGWQHDCYLLAIPKTSAVPATATTPKAKILLKLPPTGNYKPLEVKNRYGSNANATPRVPKIAESNGQSSSAAQRTYAIILSGGVNKLSNYERYWNDCSFIYQTLVNRYGVPKDNIVPLMSDGNNPAEDMSTYTGFKSQPLDLDFDGVDEINLSASKANIQSSLESIKSKIQKDDQLFFFVIDHGGTTDNNTNSYICLWGAEKLFDYELASMLDSFTSDSVNVNVVLGQCYSGGFIDNLTKVGCVVATASTGAEPSWACTRIPYDEFVYQWTSAINGATHDGITVNADTDNNHRVTMEEAFTYAKSHDSRTENPQYISTPISIGEDMAFNNIPEPVDIYIKDNPEDTGKEPNTTTNEFWKSPSIWVRNQPDGIEQHENPYYASDHETAYVYVKIYNRGKEDYLGGKYIHVYWAQASTGLTTKAWKGREVYSASNSIEPCPTGGVMEAKHIGKILAGDSLTVKVRWSLPTLLENYPEGNFQFCLLAKILDTPYDDGYKDGVTYFNLRGCNDQAQKNVTIIRKKDINKGFNVFVRNTLSCQKAYTLELIPHTKSDATIYSYAKVELDMSPKVYEAWERGGFQYEELELPQDPSNSADARKVRLISPYSKIQNITLKPDEFDIVTLKFDFNRYPFGSKTYSFDLVQKDEDGNIIGGETFIVESPELIIGPIVIEPHPLDPGRLQLNAMNPECTSYIWKDNNGNKVGDSSTITVPVMATDTKYTVIGTNDAGDIAEESITIEAINSIQSAIWQGGSIKVVLSGEACENSRISISSIVRGTVIASTPLIKGETEALINLPTVNDATYTVSYIVGEDIIDSLKISK